MNPYPHDCPYCGIPYECNCYLAEDVSSANATKIATYEARLAALEDELLELYDFVREVGEGTVCAVGYLAKFPLAKELTNKAGK